MENKITKIVSKSIVVMIGTLLFVSALLKIIKIDAMTTAFQAWGLSDFIILIGLIEMLLAILLLSRKYLLLTSIFASTYFGGAIITHLIAKQYITILFPISILILIWVAEYLRMFKNEL